MDKMNKKLSEMNLEELWHLFPIFLTEHRGCWKEWYEEERAHLAHAFPETVKISHIGSTSVEGIWAKPIIDILVEVPEEAELSAVKEKMTEIGYLCMSESADKISFNKGYTENGFAEKVFHVHVRYSGDHDELYFRDYLRAHPDAADAYERLKLKLWKEFEYNRDAYTDGKTEFVRKYTDLEKTRRLGNERNRTTLTGAAYKEGYVSLEYWTKRVNLGDTLAPVIYEWMLKRTGSVHPAGKAASRTPVHLMTVGSIVNMGEFDAAVWGSGILSADILKEVYEKSRYRKLDVRAVRGPITRSILENAGYSVPAVYGDPGVLMPLIYRADKPKPEVPYTIVPHYLDYNTCVSQGYECFNILTSDYKSFVDQIVRSKLVVSSSLHGIILSEAYGVPAVLLNYHDIDLLKYFDYYFSTGRRSVKVASCIEEALETEPMPLPDLTEMQKNLLASFPYDLFEK